jgi:hypothetical protein
MPTQPSSVTKRLDQLRGPAAPRSHDARTIAALTSNPGCSRRAVLDAAGIDKRQLATHLGFETGFGQSPFAISRGNSFEKLVKADGCVALLKLLREELKLDVPELGYVDLSRTDERADSREQRFQRTRDLFAQALANPSGLAALADHPMLTLEVGGRTAYVEPDVVAFQVAGRFHIAEIKSFPVLDGQADPGKVAAAATQAAVYVLALEQLLAGLGADPGLVATDVILVCPKDFSNAPSAALVDVRRQRAAVRRQLDRLPGIASLLEGVDPELTFDVRRDKDGTATRPAEEVDKAVASIGANYAPECVSRCDMAFYCRAEARAEGSTRLLGAAVRAELGGVDSMRQALEFAAGAGRDTGHSAGVTAAMDENGADLDAAQLAHMLGTARRVRDEALREADANAADTTSADTVVNAAFHTGR